MVRRKHQESGLDVPRHLWLDRAGVDPRAWKRGRFDWARQHPWPPGGIGFLAFYRETRAGFLAAVTR